MLPRRTFLPAFAAALALTLGATSALAGSVAGRDSEPAARDTTESRADTPQQRRYYVVTLKDPATASYTGGIAGLARTKPRQGAQLNLRREAVREYRAHLRAQQRKYRNWLAANAPRATVVDSYTLVANAVAVQRNGISRGTLAKGPGVKSVTASWLYRPAMNVSNDLINSPAVWSQLGGQATAGAGIKVGIIDTGIYEQHEFFACKDNITHQVYASGNAGDEDNVIVFDHGTHVAGTVGGCVTDPSVGVIQETLSGVAPGVELHDYNVFPGFGAGFIAFGGSAFSHDIIEAVEDSIADGMDVINLSLGGSVQGPHDTLAEAINAAADAGVVPAVAAGNSGPGDSTVQSPGSAAGALTAGASTNPHFIGIPVSYQADGGGAATIGAAVGDFNNFVPPLEADYTVTEPANGCTAISTDLSGKVALIDRGACTFSTKIRNAEAAGAVGTLVVNNVAGDPVAMAHDGGAFPEIPAAMVGKDEGAAMKPSGHVTVDGSNPQEIKSDNADIIAGFSSRGPAPFTGLIKPDATAPGVNVYSSVFTVNDAGEKVQGYALFQGTSMATPHLAGTAALLLDAHDGWSPADVKSAIVTTAKRPVTDFITGTQPVGVLARGGGRVDVAAADDAAALFDPASVSLGIYQGNAYVRAVRTVDVTGDCSAVTVTGDAAGVDATLEGDTLTVTLDYGRPNRQGTGDFTGDIEVTCGGQTLQLPWFFRVEG